jgi:putative ABC transport system substrate-binding protein
VAFGFVSSLARPGGNITGFAYLLPELSGKRLELLKEAFPKLSRVVVLWNATNPYKDADLKEVLPVAGQLKMEVQKGPVRGPNDFDDVFVIASKRRGGGLITLEDPFTIAHRKKIVDLARKYRLPALYAVSPFVEAGGLMSYGPDRGDQNRRAAKYVDRILKGTKPAELPVERPIKFEFIVNLKAAKEIGVTIAPNVLVRADRVIK